MLSWQLVLLLCCWLLRLKVCCCAQHLWCCGGQHTGLVSYGMVCGQHIPAEQQVGCRSTWSIAAHLLLLRDGSTATTLLLKLSGKESFFCLGIIFPRPRWLILSASASAEFGCVCTARQLEQLSASKPQHCANYQIHTLFAAGMGLLVGSCQRFDRTRALPRIGRLATQCNATATPGLDFFWQKRYKLLTCRKNYAAQCLTTTVSWCSQFALEFTPRAGNALQRLATAQFASILAPPPPTAGLLPLPVSPRCPPL